VQSAAAHVVNVVFISITEYVNQSTSASVKHSKNGVPIEYAVFLTYNFFALRQRRVFLFTFDFLFARNSFAGLVAYRAARFPSGLASASAFTASGNFLFNGFRNRFNHNKRPPDFLNFL
jgi:hypothetical protein